MHPAPFRIAKYWLPSLLYFPRFHVTAFYNATITYDRSPQKENISSKFTNDPDSESCSRNTGLYESSVPIKRMPQNFYLVDLRSNQCRDLAIIRLWGNTKMVPVSHKPIKTTQFFQNHGLSPHLCRSGCYWRYEVTGRSLEVKWGHNCFSPVSPNRMEIETRNWCQTT